MPLQQPVTGNIFLFRKDKINKLSTKIGKACLFVCFGGVSHVEQDVALAGTHTPGFCGVGNQA